METILAWGAAQVIVPAWVADSAAFRRWLHSGEFPEDGKVCFIDGKVWVDLSMEDFSTHNVLRAEFGRALATLMKETKFGRFVPEGMRFGHLGSELSTEPDGMVVSFDALNSRRVEPVGGESGIQSELLGSPGILIEVVSESSEVKDTEWTMSAHFDAGVQEYWVFDVRDEEDLQFVIYKRGKKEFVAVKKSGGWVKSAVLGKSFRLTYAEGADGNPEFTFEYR